MFRKIFVLIIIVIIILLALSFLKKIKQGQSLSASGQTTTSSYVLSAGDFDFSLQHDGLERVYKVHVPSSYNKENKTPLILALHGGGGSAEAGPEFFGLNAKSDQEGFIVVYPEGTGKKIFGKTFGVWNAGECCGIAVKNNVDDVGFINALIEKLETDYHIDEKRIYVTGMSNGAQMTYRLACELSDKIAAIAPSGSEGRFITCEPKRPVPTLHIQGKKDPCSLYEGGLCGKCASDFWKKIGASDAYGEWDCLSMPDYINKWRTINSCSDKTKVTFQGKGVICETYYDCQQGIEVTLCSVDNLGHNWAGQTSYGIDACDNNPNGTICNLWKKSVGPLSQELNANDQMWEFFKKYPLP
jgi:polyhydroxybutyrate depolymerase